MQASIGFDSLVGACGARVSPKKNNYFQLLWAGYVTSVDATQPPWISATVRQCIQFKKMGQSQRKNVSDGHCAKRWLSDMLHSPGPSRTIPFLRHNNGVCRHTWEMRITYDFGDGQQGLYELMHYGRATKQWTVATTFVITDDPFKFVAMLDRARLTLRFIINSENNILIRWHRSGFARVHFHICPHMQSKLVTQFGEAQEEEEEDEDDADDDEEAALNPPSKVNKGVDPFCLYAETK